MNQNPQSVPLPDDMTLDAAVPSQSNFLSKEDCTPPILAQIAYMTSDQIEDNNVFKTKSVLHFHGDLKPLIMNQVNKELLKKITGAQTLGQLKNQQIVLYNDESIMFQGRLTGGIRIRSAVQQQPVQPPPQTYHQPAPEPSGMPDGADQNYDDSIPY